MTTRPPAEIGMSLDEVDTPALIVDLDVFERTLRRLADRVRGAGEAEAMVYGGVKDVLVTNEIVGRQKLRRLMGLAGSAGPPERPQERWPRHWFYAPAWLLLVVDGGPAAYPKRHPFNYSTDAGLVAADTGSRMPSS